MFCAVYIHVIPCKKHLNIVATILSFQFIIVLKHINCLFVLAFSTIMCHIKCVVSRTNRSRCESEFDSDKTLQLAQKQNV